MYGILVSILGSLIDIKQDKKHKFELNYFPTSNPLNMFCKYSFKQFVLNLQLEKLLKKTDHSIFFTNLSKNINPLHVYVKP